MQIPVLCYHYFGPDRALQPGIKPEDTAYITPVDDFRRTIAQLTAAGFTITTLRQAPTLPPPACALTIDDAHRSVLMYALPILREFGAVATLFPVTDWVGREGYLDWAQLQRLADEGWEIGSHSRSHRRLTTLSDTDIRGELRDSGEIVSQQVKSVDRSPTPMDTRVPMTLALPMGGYSGRVVRLAREVGYHYIVSSDFGRWDGRTDNVIPRIVIKQPYDTADEVHALLTEGGLRGIELSARTLIKRWRDRLIEWKRTD